MNCTKLKLSGAYVEITSKCNLKCPYCYNNSSTNNFELDFEVIKKIVDELSEKNIHNIAISGGEPFLHKRINEIIDYCIEKKVRPNIISNLSQLSLQDIEKLLKKDVNLQITFDGSDEKTHSLTRGIGIFQKNIDAVEKAIELNKIDSIIIRYNVHKLNYQCIEEFINLMDKYNIKNLLFSFVKGIGRGKNWEYVCDNKKDVLIISDIINSLNKLSEKYPHISLSYGKPDESLGCAFYADGEIECVPRIDYNGRTFLCQLFDGDSNTLGNVRNCSLTKILVSSQTIDMLKRIQNRKVNRNGECLACPIKEYCLGGCPAIIYQNNFELFNNDGQCYLIKYFIKNRLIQEAMKNEKF